MPRPAPDNLPELVGVLKRTAAVLRDADLPVVLGGGLAIWVRGGPATEHDVDLLVRPGDADRALTELGRAGFETERPPEGWLVKAWWEKVLVDLIFAPAGVEVDDSLFARAELMDVGAQPMLVAPAEDVLVSKLLALTEHNLDYRPVLEVARALREQIDWESVARRTYGSPFAAAFLRLLQLLEIAELDEAEV